MSDSNTSDFSEITLDDFIDAAILSHGFMPYKRDYYFHIETLWKEPLAGQYLVLFRHCYEFNYRTFTGAETLLQSWDDLFIDFDKYEKAGGPEGYVWGSNHIGVYPGFTLVDNSVRANDWTEKLGKTMKEVELEAEIFKMNLVFHDWTIKKLNGKTNLISQLVFPLGE
ncbi:MAG: hypothetical protein EOP48_03965 [Sphingobacteriales bacterium]|nr:MAG: hypothetical protein EOP48_03965 [Sphingobacteriales bacterium]